MAGTLAAADIGSNTLHLLIARQSGEGLQRLANHSDWLSLGEVVSREGLIPEHKIIRLINTVKQFKSYCLSAKAEGIYLFATEAMRATQNHDTILERVFQATGINVDIVNGTRETELSWRGSLLDSKGKSPTLFIEIGGGSTQVALCHGDKVSQSISLPLGTGRLIALEDFSYPIKPFQIAHLKEHVQQTIEVCRNFGTVTRVVASGGVARGFVRALHPDGERTLAIEELDYLAWAAARLSTEQIAGRFDVKQKRAMTLVPGTIVLTSLMRLFLQREVAVSEFGVREGAVLEMFSGKINPCSLSI